MPAVKLRRGGAETGVASGACDGLPCCSGGIFKTGSAISLLLFGRLVGRILNGVAHVLFDRFQLRQQAMGVGRADALKRGRRGVGARPRQFAEQWPRGLAQIQSVDAPVRIVATALDPAIVTQLVD